MSLALLVHVGAMPGSPKACIDFVRRRWRTRLPPCIFVSSALQVNRTSQKSDDSLTRARASWYSATGKPGGRFRMMTRTNAATAASGLLLALVLATPSGSARAQNARSCLGDVVPQHGLLRAEDAADTRAVLPPQQDGADLTVTTPCIVKAGTYKFHDVHILDQGRLIFTDARIDFWAANILVEDGGSLVAGSPQAPIGTDGGVVTIHLWGADQTGSDPKKQGIGIAC